MLDDAEEMRILVGMDREKQTLHHEDEYSYHFSIEFDDGQELSESVESQHKNSDEESHAFGQLSIIYQDANIKLVGVRRNY